MYINQNRMAGKTALILILVIILSMFVDIMPSYRANAISTQAQSSTTNAKSASNAVKMLKIAKNEKNGILGIDVSRYQGDINWKKVAADGVEFAMIRATYATTIDPTFVKNAKEAYANGLDVGAYHYATFATSAEVKKEAKAFMNQLKKVKLTYPAVLDVEPAPYITSSNSKYKNLSKAKLTSLCLEFLDILEENGYKVMIYSNENFFRDHLNISKIKKYNLWVANTIAEPTHVNPAMWQFTFKGKVSGIKGDVDLNVAYKNLSKSSRASTTSTTTKPSSSSSSSSSSTTTKKQSPYSVIIDFLNDNYSANLDIKNDYTMDDINAVLYRAFQTEINRQLGENVVIDGIIKDEEVSMLAEIPFNLDRTNGRITTLIQSRLYFKRLTTSINGFYDSAMVDSLKNLQSAYKVDASGEMTPETWEAILGVA